MIDFKQQLQQFLNESILTEATADVRKTPPSFDKETEKNNKKLFGFVGSVVATELKNRGFKAVGSYPTITAIKFGASYNIAGNKNYRNEIYFREKSINVRDTGIELLTDSSKNTIQLIFRQSYRTRHDFERLKAEDIHKVIDPIVNKIIVGLKNAGATDINDKKVSTSRQYGHVIKFKDLDYDKISNYARVVSTVIAKDAKKDPADADERDRKAIEATVSHDEMANTTKRFQQRLKDAETSKAQLSRNQLFKRVNGAIEEMGYKVVGHDRCHFQYTIGSTQYHAQGGVAINIDIHVTDGKSVYSLSFDDHGSHSLDQYSESDIKNLTLDDMFDVIHFFHDRDEFTLSMPRKVGISGRSDGTKDMVSGAEIRPEGDLRKLRRKLNNVLADAKIGDLIAVKY